MPRKANPQANPQATTQAGNAAKPAKPAQSVTSAQPAPAHIDLAAHLPTDPPAPPTDAREAIEHFVYEEFQRLAARTEEMSVSERVKFVTGLLQYVLPKQAGLAARPGQAHDPANDGPLLITLQLDEPAVASPADAGFSE
jgi:hypothetical protein